MRKTEVLIRNCKLSERKGIAVMNPECGFTRILAAGSCFADRGELPPVNIKDIAPIVTALLGIAANEEREGKGFFRAQDLRVLNGQTY